jgi:glycosyltransferase involved in cell wall biosynthesis
MASEPTARKATMAPAEKPRVSVVIPVRNGEHLLPGCLDALAEQDSPPPFEVVVVDNGSTDATARVAQRHPIGARVVTETERGPYAARNTGIAHSTGEIVALTDCDCLPEPRWLPAGVAAIDAGADLVGGRIAQRHNPDPSVWERYDRATYLRQDRFVAEQGFAATANLFVRKTVFDDIGVFVPELVASGDLELGQRARAAGYSLVYAEEASVLHHPRATLRDTWELHRKLGSGFAELARAGLRPSPLRDEALRVPLGVVIDEVSADGGYVQRRQLLPVHVLAMSARWVGRLTGRG